MRARGEAFHELPGDGVGEVGFEFVEGLERGGEFGFFDEHDGYAIADGVTEAADLGHEEVAVLAEWAVGEGAAEHGQEVGGEGVGVCGVGHGGYGKR